jgi:hypothetical protein
VLQGGRTSGSDSSTPTLADVAKLVLPTIFAAVTPIDITKTIENNFILDFLQAPAKKEMKYLRFQ